MRQCLLYDSPSPNARLIGIEYMITPSLFSTLPASEQSLWHTHVFEVKSGMLIMPRPSLIPEAVWEKAETEEMKEVIELYGKTYHLWQVDRGDQVPMGGPELMGSFTEEGQLTKEQKQAWGKRDARFGVDSDKKKKVREGVEVPNLSSGGADVAWKKG